jgi:hypothetical protein
MNASLYTLLFSALFFIACGGEKKLGPGENTGEEGGKVLKETIATGKLGLDRLTGFKKNDIRDNLCQHWEFSKSEGASSAELTMDENFNPIHPQYNFFKDGTVMVNARHEARIGKWELRGRDSLHLFLADTMHKWFTITTVDSRDLRMATKDKTGKSLFLNLRGTAMVHQNMHNDPFHPVNNQWRIKPSKPESDPDIRKRVADCIKFYALYYRDNLLRKSKVINYEGFPTVFKWYNGGIGMTDEDDMDEKWVDCFFDEAEAVKGYKFMQRLIVDYEYEWPEKVIWPLKTHSVLEQMYHKAIKM